MAGVGRPVEGKTQNDGNSSMYGEDPLLHGSGTCFSRLTGLPILRTASSTAAVQCTLHGPYDLRSIGSTHSRQPLGRNCTPSTTGSR
jgi:hypothetical protein